MRVQAPKLMGFGDAIQANQSMTDSFNKLGNISQNFLNYLENQKQNAFDNQYKTDTFNETKNQNKITNANTDRTFKYGVTRDGIKDNQWQKNYELNKDSVVFDQNYKTNMFNHAVSQDGISNYFKEQQLNKPDYATFNGVDTQGNPTLSMIDKNTGKVVNTGQQVYNENKKLAPEQSLYYLDRSNEMKQKNIDAIQKSLINHPAYENLSEEDKIKAFDYVNTNGKLPQFKYSDGGWFGAEKYTMPMSDAIQEETKKTTKKDGSTIDPFQ